MELLISELFSDKIFFAVSNFHYEIMIVTDISVMKMDLSCSRQNSSSNKISGKWIPFILFKISLIHEKQKQ